MTETAPGSRALPFTVRQRLEHIEKCLFWKGEVRRADITETFGINPTQAATDFRDYMALAPGNMEYNRSAKRYQPTDFFRPVLIRPSSLADFSSLASDGIVQEVWPLPQRSASSDTLQAIVRAVRNRESIEVRYQSMTDPSPSWRRISPHAFASDGQRWHVRSFCHKRGEFRDFVLGRISEARNPEPSHADPATDLDWHAFVDVLLTPNPELSSEQQAAIASEYNMPGSGKLLVRMRKSMLFYIEAQFNPSPAPAAKQVLVEVLRQ